MRLTVYVFGAFFFVGGLAGPRAMAAGTEGCGTSTGDTTLSVSGTQGLTFTPYRFGIYRTNLTARDIELMWDTLYGDLTPDTRTTLDRFIRSMVVTTGTNPTATDATNLQVVYNTLRREGSNWNAVDPSDSLSYRVGYNVLPNELTESITSYTNADRAHSDVYLYHPSRKTPAIAEGRW